MATYVYRGSDGIFYRLPEKTPLTPQEIKDYNRGTLSLRLVEFNEDGMYLAEIEEARKKLDAMISQADPSNSGSVAMSAVNEISAPVKMYYGGNKDSVIDVDPGEVSLFSKMGYTPKVNAFFSGNSPESELWIKQFAPGYVAGSNGVTRVPNLESMAMHSPDEYFRSSDGNVYLKPGVDPNFAVQTAAKPSGTAASSTASKTSSTGYTAPSIPSGVPSEPAANFKYHLIEFTNDPTANDPDTGSGIWLYNAEEKTYRPITDFSAFVSSGAITQDTADQMLASKQVLDSSSILPDSKWSGTFLGLPYAPSATGYMKPFASTASTMKYGYARNEDLEKKNLDNLHLALTLFSNNGTVSQKALDRVFDPSTGIAAKYVEAITYGGYELSDIWRDVRLMELAESNPSYAGMTAIDPNMKASEYRNTDAWDKIAKDESLVVPAQSIALALGIGVGTAESLMSMPFYNINPEFFSAMESAPDWTDPKVREAARKIEALHYDLIAQSLQATTKEEKVKADWDWSRFREKVMKSLNINLSNNAVEAWDQLQQAMASFRQRGLANSGIEAEAIDRYSDKVVKSDARMRDSANEQISDQEVANLRANGTAEDIAAYVSKVGPEKARLQGFVASDETKSLYSLENLRKVYPERSEADLLNLQRQFIDENGNLSSTMTRTMQESLSQNDKDKLNYQQEKQAKDAADSYKIRQGALDLDMTDWTKTDSGGNLNTDKALNGGNAAGAATAASKLATLWGPTGTAPKVVKVGSSEASDLQSQGWGLTQGSYKAPASDTSKMATLWGPTGTAPKVVSVGSSEASGLQSQGWGLTEGSYKAPAADPAVDKDEKKSGDMGDGWWGSI
jgi:hypothetical protein